MDLVTRADARSASLVHYFTGKPCRNGHVAPRYTSNGQCLTCRPAPFWIGKSGPGMRNRTRIPQPGEKFGLWEVIGQAVIDGHSIRIPCRCACGLEKSPLKGNLLRGITKGCTKCYGLRMRSTDVVPGWYWAGIVANARTRGVEVGVTREHVEQLFIAQDGLCALSGRPISFTETSMGRRSLTTASLDRRDSHLGYVEGNVRWVHKIPNLMKNTLSEEEFLAWVGAIANYCETPPIPETETRLMGRFRRAS